MVDRVAAKNDPVRDKLKSRDGLVLACVTSIPARVRAQILNNNNGDPVRKGHLRKRSPTASNFIAVIPTRSICQMLAIFAEVHSKRLFRNSGKEKSHMLCSRPPH